MDEYGNPIPGTSKQFGCEEIIQATAACDFTWLENEFNHEDVHFYTQNTDQNFDKNDLKTYNTKSSPTIDDFFEEIRSIDFSQTQKSSQNCDIFIELLERCDNFIDVIGRNIVYLEEMMSEIKKNSEISIRNANKAYKAIKFENKSFSKVPILNLKIKAHLANFFKINLSNCPQNPHLKELYEHGRLILSYNGRFMLEECVERNLWNQEFKNKLESAIHEELLNKIKIPMIAQLSHLNRDRLVQKDPLIKLKIEREIIDIEKELDVISKTPFKHLVFQFTNLDTKYDWLHIAKVIDKPDLQCQRFWNLLLTPHGSRAKWTKAEDDKLIQIATKYGERNWQQIAYELATNRNELQCFIHYQKFKKNVYIKGKWSKQEDIKLMKIIKENTSDNLINWQKVYFAMHDGGRSVDQIYNRWTFCLKPGIKKGFLNEREKLIISVAQKKKFPPSVVSMNLTNRTAPQIRNAYRRNLAYKQNTFRGGWLPEEDKMLLSAVNYYAPNEYSWAQVSEQVPGRNAEQCRHRYKKIEKCILVDPSLTVETFPRGYQPYKITDSPTVPEDVLLDENYLSNYFKQNREALKKSKEQIEADADRKLKKSYLDNIYVTKHCNFSSKCDLFKYILDYLGADLSVPQTFVHKDDLMDEGLMSMMTYLKECSIESLTLESSSEKQNMIDKQFIYEGVNGVLRTSDIINSDLSEVEGLIDIRMRNFDYQKSEDIKTQNSVFINKKINSLLLYNMGSIPPNFETFKMLYTYMNSLNTCLRTDDFKNSLIEFDWDNEESKKLHQRLVAIFRWPALFSGMVDYKTAKLNMIFNTEQIADLNYSENRSYPAKKRKPFFNLKQFL